MEEVNRKFLENNGDFIGYQFAEDEMPVSGCSYWRWAAFKYGGKLYIVEMRPIIVDGKEKLTETIKIVDY